VLVNISMPETKPITISYSKIVYYRAEALYSVNKIAYSRTEIIPVSVTNSKSVCSLAEIKRGTISYSKSVYYRAQTLFSSQNHTNLVTDSKSVCSPAETRPITISYSKCVYCKTQTLHFLPEKVCSMAKTVLVSLHL
jgi:hypothetical protein